MPSWGVSARDGRKSRECIRVFSGMVLRGNLRNGGVSDKKANREGTSAGRIHRVLPVDGMGFRDFDP